MNVIRRIEALAAKPLSALDLPEPRSVGRLKRIVGLTMEAVGCPLSIGGRCRIFSEHHSVLAEVVGFGDDRVVLMPLEDAVGLEPDAWVVPEESGLRLPVAEQWIGRVVDALGRPIDKGATLPWRAAGQVRRSSALDRSGIEQPLDVGVRAVNSLMTVGRGQRIGLFAGSGVGKSVLLGMMSKFTAADVSVVALVGERNREVGEFLKEILGEQGLKRSIVVVAPADDPPLFRVKAAELALTIAESLREAGRHVLLLMDSLTRYAQAQREIALAVGEPPATKGYPPSVFATLPKLVERAGNGKPGEGSVTGIFTVLVEGDDTQEPIADAARAILDGHVVLARRLAEEGHYPAIDVEASISRLMQKLANPAHAEAARTFRRLLARYHRNEDLIRVGAYAAGSDPDTDRSLKLLPRMLSFLQQGVNESAPLDSSIKQLVSLIASP